MNFRNAIATALFVPTSTLAALAPGDIAFTAFNADEDGFAVAVLKPIAAHTTVYFSDNEWIGGPPGVGAFTTGENTYAWASGPHTLAAGTVVRFSTIDQATRTVSHGTFALAQSGTPGLSASGDSLFAYLGDNPAAPTRFLAAISSENFAGSSLSDAGLALGSSAIAVGAGADFAEYVGARSGASAFSAYAATINDASLWTSRATGDFATTVPNLTNFEIAPVPEPETYALMLMGMGLLFWRLRSRARALHPIASYQLSVRAAR
jgi:hypothetical protein